MAQLDMQWADEFMATLKRRLQEDEDDDDEEGCEPKAYRDCGEKQEERRGPMSKRRRVEA
jgi:hypothetical protein